MALGRAIKKYGKENFTKKVIEECSDPITLAKREKFWIKERNAVQDPQSYNVHEGGRGGNTGAYHKVGRKGQLNSQFGREYTEAEKLAHSEKVKLWHENEDPIKKADRIEKSRRKQKGRPKNPKSVNKMKQTKKKYWAENDVSRTQYTLISPKGNKHVFQGVQALIDWCKENKYSIWTIQCRLLKGMTPKSGKLVGWTATSTHNFIKNQKSPYSH